MTLKGSGVSWESWFEQATRSTPYSAYWSMETIEEQPLETVFEVLREAVKESAARIATADIGGDLMLIVPGVKPSPRRLAEMVGGPTSPFTTAARLSTLCSFFADETRLLIVVTADQQNAADQSLAWGLAHRGDRELSLVIPEHLAQPTQLRVPWLMPQVRVFTVRGDRVDEPGPLSHEQSIAGYRHWVGGAAAQLGGRDTWIRGVLDWLATVPAIERIERSSYVAWHVRGRQVLKAAASKTTLSVTAGVDAQGEFHGKTAVKAKLTGPADDALVLDLIAAVAHAAADRLRGVDDGHREHLMQAALQPTDIGLADWRREFPAWRPGSTRSAFIDFLGVDSGQRVHVVETKIGADTMLVLQGLDYWLWARANHDKVAATLESNSDRLPIIDYVVAPEVEGGELLSPYVPAQAEALHRTIPWRFTTLARYDDPASAKQGAMYWLPDQARRLDGVSSRWSVRLRGHAAHHATETGVTLRNGHTHKDPASNLIPQAIPAYEALRTRGLLHDHVAHVMSSQAFALNLLAPLTSEAWTAMARHHLGDPDCVVSEPPDFEYVDPADELGEATAASPHATQTDCLVRVRLGNGTQHLLFIEAKLTEDNFSTCSAATSPRNTRAHICSQPGPFGGDPTRCFQLSNHDREHRRRYDIALGLTDGATAGFGCSFRDGANQVMRNVALARILIDRGEAASASMLLLAPDDHTTIWAQWHRHITALGAVGDLSFGDLEASKVVALHDDPFGDELTRRYLLNGDLLALRRAQRSVDERFPDGVVLTTSPDDGSAGYTQLIERLVVTRTYPGGFTIEQPYPAGPITHDVPTSEWENGGAVHLPHGSRSLTLSPTANELDEQERRDLSSAARAHQQRHPYWTAQKANHGN
jgi:hypothetical protein